jgi:hypothetical protein
MAEEVQKRVTDAVNDFMEDVDKRYIRNMQKFMYNCYGSCCSDRRSSRAQVNECIEDCSKDLKNIHTVLQGDLGELQVFFIFELIILKSFEL